MTAARRADYVLLLLCLPAAAAMWSNRFVCDDALIYVRFAENLLAGHGVAYNPGEPVEGFTSAPWLALVTLGVTAGFPPLALPMLIGAVCALATLALLYAAPRLWSEAPSPLDLLAPLIAGTHAGLVAYAASGMEQPAFVLAATATVVLAVPHGRPAAHWLCAASAAALVLLRPEGLVLALACGAAVTWRSRRSPRAALGWWVLALGPTAAYVAWRWACFGDLLPNTYYAKAAPFGLGLQLGTAYVLDWLRGTLGWPAVVLVLWLYAGRPRPFLAVAALVAIGTAVLLPGDWMPLHRFLLPAVPLLALVAGESIRALHRARPGGFAWRAGVVLCAAICAGQLAGLARPATQEALAGWRRDVARWREIGRRIGEYVQPGDVVAVGAAGALGLELDCRVVEYHGVVDATIAHTPLAQGGLFIPGHSRSNADYVLSLEPRFVVVGTVERERPAGSLEEMREQFWSQAQLDLYRHPELARRYRPLNLPYKGRFVAVLVRVPEPAPDPPRTAPTATQ